jgi:hypothetical protein
MNDYYNNNSSYFGMYLEALFSSDLSYNIIRNDKQSDKITIDEKGVTYYFSASEHRIGVTITPFGKFAVMTTVHNHNSCPAYLYSKGLTTPLEQVTSKASTNGDDNRERWKYISFILKGLIQERMHGILVRERVMYYKAMINPDIRTVAVFRETSEMREKKMSAKGKFVDDKIKKYIAELTKKNNKGGDGGNKKKKGGGKG